MRDRVLAKDLSYDGGFMANSRGIIYVMTTVIPGVVKIGKTRSDQFENRMSFLESNGYRNVAGLKRIFAIEVEDYDQKELLLQQIFEKSRLSDTELFALNLNNLISLLASFEGRQIFPKDEEKSHVFENASDVGESALIPDGIYTLTRKIKVENNKRVHGSVKIINGNWTLLKGSILAQKEGKGFSDSARTFCRSISIDSRTGELQNDVFLGECSPSYAGMIVIRASNDGWTAWRDKNGDVIDIYRKGILTE